MSDPFPAVVEAAATGETADLFADIRATIGVRVVNLVWRHLATIVVVVVSAVVARSWHWHISYKYQLS